MESGIEVSRRSSRIAAIIIAAALVGWCGYFTAPACADGGQGSRALARGRRDGIAGHYRHAMRRFRQAAVKGNGEAMCDIGILYEHGEGVPQDYAKARPWFRMAAENGNGNAMCSMGILYNHGDGVPRNKDEALRWLRRAELAGGQAAVLARKDISLIKGR